MVSEKIDIHDSETQYRQACENLSVDELVSVENRELIRKFLTDSVIGKTSRRRSGGRKVGVRSRLKSLFLLRIVARYFGQKNLLKLEVNDVETFMAALEEDKIVWGEGKKYAEQTKSNLKKVFKVFLRWGLGEQDKSFHEMTYWIDTRFKRVSIQSFGENEIRRMLELCNTSRQKVLVAALFDGGFRIEEFLNIRNSDIVEVLGGAPYYRIRVRNEFSKTVGREVPMFWPESHALIKQFFSAKDRASNPDQQFFQSSYEGVRKTLKKIGTRMGVRITAHMFRHSSATHYANQGLNEFQLNKRYGWSSGSDMGRQYVEHSRILLEDKKQIVQYESGKLEDLQLRLQHQEQANGVLQGTILHLREGIESLKGDLFAIRSTLKTLNKAGA